MNEEPRIILGMFTIRQLCFFIGLSGLLATLMFVLIFSNMQLSKEAKDYVDKMTCSDIKKAFIDRTLSPGTFKGDEAQYQYKWRCS